MNGYLRNRDLCDMLDVHGGQVDRRQGPDASRRRLVRRLRRLLVLHLPLVGVVGPCHGLALLHIAPLVLLARLQNYFLFVRPCLKS